jgi:chromosome segregation ATPase|tara:strand:- start:498 stop:755 length:258 start_codon:yes stop_codon:yes gene_type:complete
MTNPVDLIDEEIKTAQEQLDIDIKKVSLLQQEIKQIQEQAQAAINEKQTQINNATQPIIENQGSLKKLKELKNKLEGKIETTTKK